MVKKILGTLVFLFTCVLIAWAAVELDSNSDNKLDDTYKVDEGNMKAGSAHSNLSTSSDIGTGADQVAAGNHNHSGTYEPADATILKEADVLDEDNMATDSATYPPSQQSTKAYIDTVVREEFIPISWCVFNGSLDPGDETETNIGRYRDFDPSTSENGEFYWMAPAGLTGSTLKIRAVNIITSSTTPAIGEGVSWYFTSCSSGTDDPHDCTVGTDVNSEDADLSGDASAQWDIVFFPYVEITPTDLAGGESVHFFFSRDVADTDDDYAQDIGLLGFIIKWQENRSTLTY